MGGFHRIPRFAARTVLVHENNVDDAMKLLNRVLGSEGWIQQWRRTRFHEKPTYYRQRINYEKAISYYNEDMDRKVKFVLRKNRMDPWVGSN